MYRMLIADDEKDICENLRLLTDWQRYGISSIITAASYEEAIDKAVEFRPHIAFIDMNLNGHWGHELIESLRAAGLPTIFCMISGYDDFQYVRQAMRAGAKDYLLKPICVQELLSYLENVITNDLHGTFPTACAPPLEIDPVLKKEYTAFSKITSKIMIIAKGGYQHPLSLTDIGDMFNMNSKYIGRIFLKDTGMKFSEYLMAYRMHIAKNKIEGTREKISSIAAEVGYPHLNNFYVDFKAYYGISPGTLRNCREEQPTQKGADIP